MDTRCIFPQHTAQILSVIIQAVTWLACKKISLFIISTSKQKGFSHRNFLLHFLTKARPYGWCNQWYQVGTAHMLLCYYELGPHCESTKGHCCLGHWLLGVKQSPGQEYCSPHSMACTEIQTHVMVHLPGHGQTNYICVTPGWRSSKSHTDPPRRRDVHSSVPVPRALAGGGFAGMLVLEMILLGVSSPTCLKAVPSSAGTLLSCSRISSTSPSSSCLTSEILKPGKSGATTAPWCRVLGQEGPWVLAEPSCSLSWVAWPGYCQLQTLLSREQSRPGPCR